MPTTSVRGGGEGDVDAGGVPSFAEQAAVGHEGEVAGAAVVGEGLGAGEVVEEGDAVGVVHVDGVRAQCGGDQGHVFGVSAGGGGGAGGGFAGEGGGGLQEGVGEGLGVFDAVVEADPFAGLSGGAGVAGGGLEQGGGQGDEGGGVLVGGVAGAAQLVLEAGVFDDVALPGS
ncbi:hypothetical protein ACFT0G_02825 [Streptomyces sp. NPDC057020]|uniref:hypothetical protein n=1 Tax=unclassified Streptomyces TaxID=2593676 RepID=UPI00362AF703